MKMISQFHNKLSFKLKSLSKYASLHHARPVCFLRFTTLGNYEYVVIEKMEAHKVKQAFTIMTNCSSTSVAVMGLYYYY